LSSSVIRLFLKASISVLLGLTFKKALLSACFGLSWVGSMDGCEFWGVKIGDLGGMGGAGKVKSYLKI
ncbi:MAG: hypothetical protein KBF31_06040, partial [Chitinophagales bacterium]|nr:hypothetical protein [Chitinophagales bacterium]